MKVKKEKKSIKKNLKGANTTKSSEVTSVQPTELETSNFEPTLTSKNATDSDLGETQKTTEPLSDLKSKNKKKSRKEKRSTKSSEPTLSFLNTVITTETELNSLPSDRVIKNTCNNAISISNPEKRKFDNRTTRESPSVSEPQTGARFSSLESIEYKAKVSSLSEEPETSEIFMSAQTELRESTFPSTQLTQQKPRENPESTELELKVRPRCSEQRVRECSPSPIHDLIEISISAEQEPREISPSVEQETRESSPSAEQETRESSLSVEQKPRESSLIAEQETREISSSVDQEPKENTPIAEQETRESFPSVKQKPRESSPFAKQEPRKSSLFAEREQIESVLTVDQKPRESSPSAEQEPRGRTPSAEQELRVSSSSVKHELRESSPSAEQETRKISPSSAFKTRESFKSKEHKVRETHLTEASEDSELHGLETKDFSNLSAEAGSIEMEENSQLNICDDKNKPEDTNDFKEYVGVSPKDKGDLVPGQFKPGVVSKAISGDGSSREETVLEVNNADGQGSYANCLPENDVQVKYKKYHN